MSRTIFPLVSMSYRPLDLRVNTNLIIMFCKLLIYLGLEVWVEGVDVRCNSHCLTQPYYKDSPGVVSGASIDASIDPQNPLENPKSVG